MALDFAQIDQLGQVTGHTVRLDRETHHSVIQKAPAEQFPLIARMHDYYEDVLYTKDQLFALADELSDYATTLCPSRQARVLQAMCELVQDSIVKGLSVEAIAD